MSIFPYNDFEDIYGMDSIFKSNNSVNPKDNQDDNISEQVSKVSLSDIKKSFAELALQVKNCTKCQLAESRNNTVFGEGSLDAKLMFIGEGPGADEDRTGRPFVGRSGQLLTKMIVAMGLKREQVYIANIVKCRPPNNRNPYGEEAAACIGYIKTQLRLINPDYIICLGSVAVNFLLGITTPITKLRGNWVDFHGYKVMPTYHPSYLLRSPNKKVEAWQDLKMVMKELGLPIK